MRRVIGPIMTTGGAIVVAAVVVANPIVAPRADVRIPAIALSSGTDETGGMLDKAFLDAIAPAPPESTNPFAVLKLLITSLAADASYIGRTAIVGAFVAGVTAVSEPELTSVVSPYIPPHVDPPAPVVPPLPVLPALQTGVVAGQVPLPSLPTNVPPVDLSAFIGDSLTPAVQQLVNSLVSDVGYVGQQVVAVAFAMGAAVAAEPGMIADTVRALTKGDLNGALQSAIKVVTVPFGPTGIVIDTIRTLVEKRVADLREIAGFINVPIALPAIESVTDPATLPVADPANGLANGQDAPPATATVPQESSAEAVPDRRTTRRQRTVAPIVLPAPAAAESAAADQPGTNPPGDIAPRAEARGILAAVTESAPTAVKPPPPRRGVGTPIRDTVRAIGDRIGAAVSGAAKSDTASRARAPRTGGD